MRGKKRADSGSARLPTHATAYAALRLMNMQEERNTRVAGSADHARLSLRGDFA